MRSVPRAGSAARSDARRFLLWLVVPVLALLAVLSIVQYRQRLDDSERSLQRRADERAQDLEALARPAEAHVSDLRRLLEHSWDRPPDAGPELRRALAPWRDARDGIDGWTLDQAGDTARRRYGQIWWGSAQGEPPPDIWLNRAAQFQAVARVVLERAPGFEGSAFVSTETNMSWSYPWVDTPGMLRAGEYQDLRALDQERERSFAKHKARFAERPQGYSHWGKVYPSQLHGNLVISYAQAVISGARFLGEVSVDFRLDVLQAAVNRWQDGSSRIWVVDGSKRVLADSLSPLMPPAGDGVSGQTLEMKLTDRLQPDMVAALAPHWNEVGPAAIHRIPGWVLLTATRPGSPWVYVQAVPASMLRDQVLPSLLPNAVLGLALLVTVVMGQWLFKRWFVDPSLRVLDYLRQLSDDRSTPAPELGRRWAGWVRAVHDNVQRQHRAFEQVERQREALRQSEKLSAMGTLLAGVAHELNNPLAIVMGRAALLDERVGSAEPQAEQRLGQVRDDARRIRDAAERCGRIVRTFLNMARQRPPTRRGVQLQDVVKGATDMLGYTMRSHGIRVVVSVPEVLPVVQADPDQLGQIVLNLMVNAQHAMEHTESARILTLSAGVTPAPPEAGPEATAQLWLRVTDTGHGVPAHLRDSLFEPFFTTKDAGQGTGLGLSMSRTIAREHGGELILETSSASGTCFCLTLPLDGTRAREPEAVQPAPVLDSGPCQRILVVDDELEIAEITRSILETAGYEVATAESGALALEMLDTARFDAIVSDMRMADLDGVALWRAVRERHPALARRTLFVTGDTLSPAARQALEVTGCPSLDKPFDRDDLLRAVMALLQHA